MTSCLVLKGEIYLKTELDVWAQGRDRTRDTGTEYKVPRVARFIRVSRVINSFYYPCEMASP